MDDKHSKNFFLQNCRFLTQLFLFLGLGLAIYVLNNFRQIDFFVSDYFFQAPHRFFLTDGSPWIILFHDGLRWVSFLLWVLLALYALQLKPSAQRAEVLFLVSISALCGLLVSVLKYQSLHSCPSQLLRYGGAYQHFGLFQMPALASGPGHCFPSGHAAVVWMWVGVFYTRLSWVQKHRVFVVSVFAVLAVMVGWVQIARGAHFFSHVLASAWVAWGLSWPGAGSFYRKRAK